jgi:hypothetical protein
MKKFIKVAMTAALSLIMVLGMAMTAFAASPTVTIDDSPNAVVDKDNNPVSGFSLGNNTTVDIDSTKAMQVAGSEERKDTDAKDVVATDTLTKLKVHDINVPSGFNNYPVSITFVVNLNDGEDIAVYHCYDTANDKWELIGVYTVANSKITVKFDSLSPIALFQVNHNSTGDSSHVILWGSLMLVAAAGVVGLVAFGKKRR